MPLNLEKSCLDSILYKFFPKSVSFRTIPKIYWSLERQERENVNRVWEGGNNEVSLWQKYEFKLRGAGSDFKDCRKSRY